MIRCVDNHEGVWGASIRFAGAWGWAVSKPVHAASARAYNPSTQNLLRPAEILEARASELAVDLGEDVQPDLDLNISRVKFPTGRDLVEAAKELGVTPKPDEVVQ